MASLSDMLKASAGLATSASGSTDLSGIFSEEPVSLDVFVRDKKFLGNPPLSSVQYDAVRHVERIYYPSLYPVMGEAFGGDYWTAPYRMVNFITLQWGKLPEGIRKRPHLSSRVHASGLLADVPTFSTGVLRHS